MPTCVQESDSGGTVEAQIHLRSRMTRPDLGFRVVILRRENRTKAESSVNKVQLAPEASPELGLEWWRVADSVEKRLEAREILINESLGQ